LGLQIENCKLQIVNCGERKRRSGPYQIICTLGGKWSEKRFPLQENSSQDRQFSRAGAAQANAVEGVRRGENLFFARGEMD
jgi:hypothetical protein